MALILAVSGTGTTPYRVTGKGFLTDASHPKRPGDVQRHEATLAIALDPEAGIASIEIGTGEGATQDVDRYFVRRGRIFQIDDKGEETQARDLGDLSAAAVAALHPGLVDSAMRERAEDVQPPVKGSPEWRFAWNDVLWRVYRASRAAPIVKLTRHDYDGRLGDGLEVIDFKNDPRGVSVRLRDRETASFEFGPIESVASVEIPKGDPRRDRGHVIRAEEIDFTELAPHLYAIELASISSRVFVAEFEDHLAVLEGAYDPRNGDLIARSVRTRFGKPVRFHAFSHLHGQYIGSTRSWVADGATIVVPPSTAPLVREIVAGRQESRPDALSEKPKALRLEEVATSRALADGANRLVIYNVPSEHTDEYFVFWFPGPKILLTGDLLFYRPGKPLAGRSKRLCRTVADLGLQVERYVATWPLEGYETKSVVTGEEMKAACEPLPAP